MVAISILPFHHAVGEPHVLLIASSGPWLADALRVFLLIAAMADVAHQAQFAAGMAVAVRWMHRCVAAMENVAAPASRMLVPAGRNVMLH